MVYSAEIVSGYGRGRRINFPTLNLRIPNTFPFEHGIYAGWVLIENQKYPAAFHFGSIPVFQETAISLEAFVIGTQLIKTPQTIRFELIARLRDILNFETPDQLAAQIEKDIRETKKILGY